MPGLKSILAGLFLTSLVISSCSRDEDSDTSQTGQYLSQGQWFVEYYFDQTDETSDFNNVVFTFSPQGTVSSNTGSGGSWQVITADGKRKLIINFATNSVLQQLNEAWVITSSSAGLIQLRDDNVSNHELRLRRL